MAVAPSGAEIRSVAHSASLGTGSFGAGDTRVGVSLPSLDSPFVGPIFADAMKQASPWSSSSPLHLDASGNVLSLTRGQVADSTIFASAAYPSGDYTLLYDGTGTLEVAGARALQQAPGRAILRVEANRGGIHVRLSATAPNDPVRNIRLVLPGYESKYATRPFLPNAVNVLRQFHVLRFEQWSRVAVDTAVESWPFRATPASVTQAGAAGVAPEYAIALANATGDDPWFVLPVGATDAYVTHLAQLVGTTLDPRLHPIFQFAEDPLAAGSATSAYATVAGLAERRASDPRAAAVLWHASRSEEVLDAITLASAGTAVRPVRVLGLPSGASPGAFEASAARAVMAAGARHADAVAVGSALANGAVFRAISASAARARLALFGSDFELQPALLSNSANARALYGAALERWYSSGGALAIVPSDATSALWAGARDYTTRHPYPHAALAPFPQIMSKSLTQSTAASNAAIPAVAQSGVFINVGGPAVGSFVADPSTQHGTYPESTLHPINTNGVTNPAPAAVYASARVGAPSLTYTIGGLMPGATYAIRLDFAEEYFTKPGSRVFNIVINGTTAQTNYDIVGMAGAPFTATAFSATALANSSGQIVIALSAVVNKALLSGIEVVPTGAVPTPTPSPAPGLDINVGGPAVGTFVADTNPYQHGTYAESTTNAIDTSGVASPAPVAVYQSARVGGPNLLYTIAGLTPGVAYAVRLDFAEEFFTKRGSREFNIAVNGVTVQANYDIVAAAGGAAFKATAFSTNATPNASGQIVIALNATVNKALLSGIEIVAPVVVAPTPSPTPTPTASPTPTPTASPTPPPTPSPTPTASPTPSPTPVPSPIVTFLTSGTTWQVPLDWNSSNNEIEAIGGGGGGGSANGGGGGGGAYTAVTNLALAGGTTLSISVGAGGGGGQEGNPGLPGLDTYVCPDATPCFASGALIVASGGGSGPFAGGGGGSGGSASSGPNTTSYPGGNGGGDGGSSGAGGGGAAGPRGAGAAGADGGLGSGGGGGGNGGGSAGSSGTLLSGGNGGNNYLMMGGGAGGSGDGTNGTAGGGGGGAGGGVGGSGGNGSEWTGSFGSGGGGGGGTSTGGNAGSYGGGGGGGSPGGSGAGGLIVITYTPNGVGPCRRAQTMRRSEREQSRKPSTRGPLC